MTDYDDRLIIKAKSSAKSGAEREARRKRERTLGQVEKERADSRVGMVANRAGGLSQARREDVRAMRDVENTPKCTHLTVSLPHVPRAALA